MIISRLKIFLRGDSTTSIWLLIFCLHSVSLNLNAQESKTDSLKAALRVSREDTQRVNILNALAWKLKNIQPDSSIQLSKEAERISKKLGEKKQEGTSLHQLGAFYWQKGDYKNSIECCLSALEIWRAIYPTNGGERAAATLGNLSNSYASQSNYKSALHYYNMALGISVEIKNKKLQASNLGNIGVLHMLQSNYPEALKYFFRSLKISEEIADDYTTSGAISNIGTIYMYQKDYDLALNFYAKGLRLSEKLNDQARIAAGLGNMGGIYAFKKEYTKALDFFRRAVEIVEKTGNKANEASFLNNIGLTYLRIKDYENSVAYFSKALIINKELNNSLGEAINRGNIGIAYIGQKKYSEAEKNLKTSLEICRRINATSHIKNFEKSFSELDSLRGDNKGALDHYKKHIAARDSIYNEENIKKTVQAQMQYDFDKKESEAKAAQEKKDALAAEEKKKQIIIRNSFIVGFGLVGLLALFIFRGYRNKQKSNLIISKQKEEVERSKNIIEQQKHLVEEKQKEIVDSIRYAQRIQNAVITNEKYIQKNLDRLKS